MIYVLNLKKILFTCTVKPVLGDHCLDRPPALKINIFLAKGPYVSAIEPITKDPPVLRDEIFMAVFQDRLYCIYTHKYVFVSVPDWRV